MARTIFVFEALPPRLMRGRAKEDVIQYLAAAAGAGVLRRRWYREWCRATMSSCRPEDLARVAPPRKPREYQLGLLP